MREWEESELSMAANSYIAVPDGYCASEPLQYYGEQKQKGDASLEFLPLKECNAGKPSSFVQCCRGGDRLMVTPWFTRYTL